MSEITIVNLTPHAINICNEDGEPIVTVEPSGEIARIDVSRRIMGMINGIIPVFSSQMGMPYRLPSRIENTIYIVSGMFKAQVDRSDLYQPGELLRNEKRQPIGCIGLSW